MLACSNCQKDFATSKRESISVHHASPPNLLIPVIICDDCLEGVAVIKVVLRRGEDGVFKYDGYQPVEAMKRAFGK